MRIGLYGGSFNPVHIAHVNVAKHAIESLNLDRLIFLPCFQSVDKPLSEYAPADHRINMLNLVLPDKCEISTYEIDRGEAIESIETFRYFRDLYKDDELFFIMGEDSLVGIHTWQDFQEFDSLLNLVVFRRKLDTSGFVNRFNLRLTWMNNELWNMSAKEIRNEGARNFLDAKVEAYIKLHKLYNL
ncbi:nicotinate-nucleotide adenylyltransferase [Mycoplasma haemofelis str. Langford 1]|uniref:Probable nicotinate-nucleotide adenylyltransferase n=2 Tax=Mycoplasma haemofelis TaxID=29501 RepID=F6FJE2_MYCHI|nr:nicotinate (nicotinamide) nucleotide adenylyltransferase [Mycoplasma haemofelis]AEG72361.1 nicotinate-nucleotide adenylyltransferase [Mycoplasma haemofelis Ohio2]CBY92047.1 nicotinate-nucleotide adenylyltransferase [Mycoplasma haemofelis str. Langford 1]